MTTEEKAKAYDKAIEKLRDFYRDYDTISYLIDVKEELANLFPELAESKEERIRKEIIAFIKRRDRSGCDYDYDKWIAWLEKQGEKSQYWKPSEEQLSALDYAYNSCSDTERGNYYEGVLETLIDDLHKLPEKPKWTEEDDYNVQCCIAKAERDITNGYTGRNKELIEWLESLKQRMEK